MDATGGRAAGDRADPMNDTRAARDNRTTEAIAMKDRQIQLLQDQTSQLLRSLDKVGEDAAQLHMSKLAVEEVRGAAGLLGPRAVALRECVMCASPFLPCLLPRPPSSHRKTARCASKTLSCSPRAARTRTP